MADLTSFNNGETGLNVRTLINNIVDKINTELVTSMSYANDVLTVVYVDNSTVDIPIVAGGGGANLAYTASATNGIVTSDTGTDATIPLADGTNAGLFTAAEKTKLSGIEAGADVTDATNVSAAGAPIISSGAGVPASTPSKVGDIYIDTTNDDAYIAVGIASSADWEKTNDGAGGGISDGDKGDITVSSSGATWTIDNGVVTLAKQADMATASVVYRKTAGAGAPEVQTLATLKTDLGLSNTNSGDNAVNSLYSGLTQYTNEMAQDAVGAILDTGASQIKFTYNDETPLISAIIYDGSVTATELDATTNASLALADSAVQAASSTIFTNKTFDANGTGNSISNIEVADLASGVLDTDLSSVAGTDTTIPSAKATKAALDLKADKNAMPVTLTVACSDETTALTTGVGKVTFRMPHLMTLTGVRASLNVAQTSGNIITIDINDSGTSVMSTTKITIDNGEKTSVTAVTPAVITDSSLGDDNEISIDIDQIGDGTAKGLKVTLIGTRSI